MLLSDAYKHCVLCPRACGIDRTLHKKGYCGMNSTLMCARAALHEWEEPGITVGRGSGTVFFSGCSLRCKFCQNYDIAHASQGQEISLERLIEIYFELKDQGAANINLVTAAHFLPHVQASIIQARNQGLDLPFVYNSSGYESVFALRAMRGLLDVFLVDVKYTDVFLAKNLSHAKDYPKLIEHVVDEMLSQAPKLIWDTFNGEDRIAGGVIIRHLLLPGHLHESKKALRWIHERWGNRVKLSIMSQFTPCREISGFPELNVSCSESEYEELLDYADELGIEDYFWQEGQAALESFIPAFDQTGVTTSAAAKTL